MKIENTDHVYCEMDTLPGVIQEILTQYSIDTREDVSVAVKKVTKQATKIVKSNANVDKRNTPRKGKYKRSIRSKTVEEVFQTEGIVYAGGHEYSLTHLLENGHFLWNAPNRRTGEFKHWKLGEEYAVNELPLEIMKQLKG